MAARLALYENGLFPAAPMTARARQTVDRDQAVLCAGCREREARYGFHDGDHPALDRPRTLCFDCFRAEINRRQAVAARLARGWNATQTELPLDKTLESLRRRRGRAQIAARKALELR